MSSVRVGKQWRRGRAVALAMVSSALTGCVSVERTLPDGRVEQVPRAELPQYAEAVFKRHNAVSTAFLEPMLALEESSPQAYAQLAEAEDQMTEACAPVDALAIAYRDGERIGVIAKLRLARALESCEQATELAAAQLESLAELGSGQP